MKKIYIHQFKDGSKSTSTNSGLWIGNGDPEKIVEVEVFDETEEKNVLKNLHNEKYIIKLTKRGEKDNI